MTNGKSLGEQADSEVGQKRLDGVKGFLGNNLLRGRVAGGGGRVPVLVDVVFLIFSVILDIGDCVFVVRDLAFLLGKVVIDLLIPLVVVTAGVILILILILLDIVLEGLELLLRLLLVGLLGILGLLLQSLVGSLSVLPSLLCHSLDSSGLVELGLSRGDGGIGRGERSLQVSVRWVAVGSVLGFLLSLLGISEGLLSLGQDVLGILPVVLQRVDSDFGGVKCSISLSF